MFTGLIEEAGQVVWLRQSSESGLQLQVEAPRLSRGAHRGDSVAVNGCCLTITNHRENRLTFDLLRETLDRTNLHKLRPQSYVNLERPMPADGRFGGHMVQGHVDCASALTGFEQVGDDYRLEIELPDDFRHYVVYKGSVTINGISLTVAEKLARSFICWVIPHTRKTTNLFAARAGELVNIEFDILAKYVESQLERYQPRA